MKLDRWALRDSTMSWWQRLFRKREAIIYPDVLPRSVPGRYPKPKPKELAWFRECYFCGSQAYYEGPSGGLSMNITCAGCGARFNVAFLPNGIAFQEELSGPTKLTQ